MALRTDITIAELITLRDALVRLQSIMAKYFQGQYMPPPVSSTETAAVEAALAGVTSAITALEAEAEVPAG